MVKNPDEQPAPEELGELVELTKESFAAGYTGLGDFTLDDILGSGTIPELKHLVGRTIAPRMLDARFKGVAYKFNRKDYDEIPADMKRPWAEQYATNIAELLRFSKNGRLYYAIKGNDVAFWVDVASRDEIVDDIKLVIARALGYPA